MQHPHSVPIHLVWFKRDLRTCDHAALHQAWYRAKTLSQPLLPLCLFEFRLWTQPDTSGRHSWFWADSVQTLSQRLQTLGSRLVVSTASVTDVLAHLLAQGYAPTLYSHQETGNDESHARDRTVERFCRAHRIEWHQPRQLPIQRGRHTRRDRWASEARHFFDQACLPEPDRLPAWPDSLTVPGRIALHRLTHYLPPDPLAKRQDIQAGGRDNGLALLNTFLHHRHHRYLRTLSKPSYHGQFSSRLSAHLAFGTLSMREVIRAARQALADSPARRDLKAFIQRLHWQSHFMQKLETEPDLTHRALHPVMRALEQPFNDTFYQAWLSGRTGYPLVDACMRCVATTGWLPFRMRALVMSFASYQLNLPWQTTSKHLARCFTDYEPGIHYPQVQMQSGMTGINAMRVYNPVKQSIDQDADGRFIAHWLPELAHLPTHWRHTPWELATHQREALTLASHYPTEPIVWHPPAARAAKQLRSQWLKTDQAKAESRKVYQTHGSRRRANARRKNTTLQSSDQSNEKPQGDSAQLPLF
ncbi:FAD-binding domain-containing protein [Hydrogenovibrio halophilus]|uniref:FAD-binding domain-containing protein n=1 Tax=Hydrogenovibrio halophilus TaxID=373391 RepID=UPI00037D2739|nr:FAD-binding domain-containing protein [Hydrogenovibrio halophilus]